MSTTTSSYMHMYMYIHIHVVPWEFCPDPDTCIYTTIHVKSSPLPIPPTELKKALGHVHRNNSKGTDHDVRSDPYIHVHIAIDGIPHFSSSELEGSSPTYVGFPCAIYKRPGVPHSLVP